MSEEGSVGLSVAERFLGLLVIVLGSLAAYYTYTSIQVLENFAGFFGFLSIVLIIVGIILITAKME